MFDFGEWKGEVASRPNPDGTVSFLTTAPGIVGFEFVVGSGPQPSLIVRDAQHEYAFAGNGSAPPRTDQRQPSATYSSESCWKQP